MDKISDFFKDIKERLSNPLFVSFIISWLIFNWKIIIVLFFYNNQELKVDGYVSYIDFISKNLGSHNTIWKPLLASLLYTFIFPFLRNCMLAFDSWIKAWGRTWNLTISKTSKISIAKYVELRDIYEARTALLQDVLEKESIYLKEYEEEKSKTLELTNEKNSNIRELEKWQSVNDGNQLNGEWEIHYTSSPQPTIYRVRINHSIIEYLDNPPPNTNGRTTIRSFSRNPNTTFLTFLTMYEDESRNRSYHFFQLDMLDDMKILRGLEDDSIKIEFRKSR